MPSALGLVLVSPNSAIVTRNFRGRVQKELCIKNNESLSQEEEVAISNEGTAQELRQIQVLFISGEN